MQEIPYEFLTKTMESYFKKKKSSAYGRKCFQLNDDKNNYFKKKFNNFKNQKFLPENI